MELDFPFVECSLKLITNLIVQNIQNRCIPMALKSFMDPGPCLCDLISCPVFECFDKDTTAAVVLNNHDVLVTTRRNQPDQCMLFCQIVV